MKNLNRLVISGAAVIGGGLVGYAMGQRDEYPLRDRGIALESCVNNIGSDACRTIIIQEDVPFSTETTEDGYAVHYRTEDVVSVAQELTEYHEGFDTKGAIITSLIVATITGNLGFSAIDNRRTSKNKSPLRNKDIQTE